MKDGEALMTTHVTVKVAKFKSRSSETDLVASRGVWEGAGEYKGAWLLYLWFGSV